MLRKLAHFSEFACLGALLGWLTGMLKKPNFGVPTGLGCLAACVDETIQRFVPGRGPSLTDVGIDTCGAAVGAILLLVGYTIYHKTHTLEVTT